jgi:hypothetical protein
MKVFRVVLVQHLEISFDDFRATAASAEHVALKCWGARALTGDLIEDRQLGRIETKLLTAELGKVEEVSGGRAH